MLQGNIRAPSAGSSAHTSTASHASASKAASNAPASGPHTRPASAEWSAGDPLRGRPAPCGWSIGAVNSTGQGLFLDIALGIVGAVVGGFLFSVFGAEGVTASIFTA
jgi:hypothetical protein